MKKHLLSFLFCMPFFMGLHAQINIQWQSRYAGAGPSVDRGEDMVMDAAGNTYVTGIGVGTSGNFDYITIKYNTAGVQQWIAQYNGTGSGLDEAHAIAVDTSGNVYVTGWSYGGASTGFDYATVKYNSAGVQQWATRYNNTTNGTDEAWDVAVDYAGNVYVAGTSDGSGTNSAATSIKYNAAGVQQYAKRYEGAGSSLDVAYAITVDAVTGDYWIAGYTYQSAASDLNYLTVKYNTAGTQQWVGNYNGPDDNTDEAHAIAVDAAGNVYVTGYIQTDTLTNYNYATVKYNAAGVQQWASIYDGPGHDYDRANAVKVDAAGNVYVTGKSVGAGADAEDMFTIKYDGAGVAQWSARYNGTAADYDEGKALDVDALGNVYVTGYSTVPSAVPPATNSDYTTIKYDASGVQQWITKYNGTASNSDQAVAIAVDNIGNVFISGFSKGAGANEDFETIKYCQLTANAGSDVTICNGGNTTLNASALGAVSYAWLPNDGTLSSLTSATPIANPTTTTSYYVAITNTNGCVDLDTVVVTVVPLPAPAITPSGPTSFCVGGSVTLTSSPSSQYQWSSNVNDTLASITVVNSGTYSVTVTDTNGCAAISSQVVTVLPLPTINAGADDSTCLSTNINLAATGGASYIWHPGTSLSDSTIVNPIAGPVLTTTYTVIGTSAGGCVNTDSVTITVLGNPGVPTISKSNDTLYCSATGVSYQWYSVSLGLLPGETNQYFQYTVNGNYYCQITNALGCSTTSVPFTVFDIGIEELNGLSLMNVYPNPATDAISLDLNFAKAQSIQINLLNIAGQVVYTEALNQTVGAYQQQIDLNEKAKGIYHLQIITNDGIINKKIIKQ